MKAKDLEPGKMYRWTDGSGCNPFRLDLLCRTSTSVYVDYTFKGCSLNTSFASSADIPWEEVNPVEVKAQELYELLRFAVTATSGMHMGLLRGVRFPTWDNLGRDSKDAWIELFEAQGKTWRR